MMAPLIAIYWDTTSFCATCSTSGHGSLSAISRGLHLLVNPELGRAAPYGVYDIADNAGWVSVGIDHDTASFAANSIRRWWQLMGHKRYPKATTLLITADLRRKQWGACSALET